MAWELSHGGRACRELSVPLDRTDSLPSSAGTQLKTASSPHLQTRLFRSSQRSVTGPCRTPVRIGRESGRGGPIGRLLPQRAFRLWSGSFVAACTCTAAWGRSSRLQAPSSRPVQGDSGRAARRSTMVHLSECAGLSGAGVCVWAAATRARRGHTAFQWSCFSVRFAFNNGLTVQLWLAWDSQCIDRMASNSFLDCRLPLPPRCDVIKGVRHRAQPFLSAFYHKS